MESVLILGCETQTTVLDALKQGRRVAEHAGNAWHKGVWRGIYRNDHGRPKGLFGTQAFAKQRLNT